MRRLAVATALAAVGACMVGASEPVSAEILVNISKSSQRMSVLVDGSTKYNWLVSTGAKRYTTPNGVYQPQWLARKWRSRQYRNAPMPHSIFFHRGYAIHGTTEISRLGKIASHGCVRLHPENAAKLYALVKDQMAETRIVVSNDRIDEPGAPPVPKKPGQLVAEATIEEPAIATSPPPTELLIAEKAAIPSQLVAEARVIRDIAAAPARPAAREPAEMSAAAAPAQPIHVVSVAKPSAPENLGAGDKSNARAAKTQARHAARDAGKAPAPRAVARMNASPGFDW